MTSGSGMHALKFVCFPFVASLLIPLTANMSVMCWAIPLDAEKANASSADPGEIISISKFERNLTLFCNHHEVSVVLRFINHYFPL